MALAWELLETVFAG